MNNSYLFFLCSISILTACSGGSSEDNDSPDVDVVEKSGQLIDSTLAGVTYQTPTYSGITDSEGRYSYLEGELVTFTIGGVSLGGAVSAGPLLTPLDLLGATHPTDPAAVNMMIFLQSIDEDGDPSNGIVISQASQDLAADLSLDFSSLTFIDDVTTVVDLVTEGENTVVSSEDALTHFFETYSELGGEAELGFEFLDTDTDGIPDALDPDDDNDGVIDTDDAFPLDELETLDTDLDGFGNNTDTDDDNDGVIDTDDAFPLDELETLDTDLDGVGNNTDTDDDNDGTPDASDNYPLDSERVTNNPPTVTAGTNQSVVELTVVTLAAVSSDSDGSISSYAWSQSAGTSVTLSNPAVASPTFTAPDVSGSEMLTFTVTATDNEGASNVDSVNVTVFELPVAPVLNAVEGNTIIDLSWSNIANSDNYNLYYAEETMAGDIANYASYTGGTLVTGLIGTIHNLTSLTNDTTYYLTLTAVNLGGEGLPANEVSAMPVVPMLTGKLNDTGSSKCTNYPYGGTETHSNNENCANAPTSHTGDPLPAGQDGQYGRDATHNDDSDGLYGFSFTKLDSNGDDLAANAASWECIKDNVTGFIWEVKQTAGGSGLRDSNNTYTWYNSSGINDGGTAGTADGGACTDSGNCDTEKLVAQVNATGLCGANDWRLPTRGELRGIYNYDGITGLSTAWFKNTQKGQPHWTSTPYLNTGQIMTLFENYGGFLNQATTQARYVMLVRGQ
ncbi:MAG: DUF1566 domain-containing protein [Oleispira sp.]|nr:DUF1566 domain-containing protein [Oleispira sp.]